MTEDELRAILTSEIAGSLGYTGSDLADQRIKALERYYGDKLGNEQEGRSQVVSRDVMDTVEGILPHLIKIFCSGDEVGRFEPQGPEDQAGAEQATDYANWIINRDNPGFAVFYAWFKDALIQKNGFLKVWWETGERSKKESYYGLTPDAFATMAEDINSGEVEVVAAELKDDPVYGQTRDLVLKRTEEYGCVKIACVPPEEVLISRRARDIADAPFIGHRTLRTISSLREDGYDKKKLDTLPTGTSDIDESGEAMARDRVGENQVSDTLNTLNDAMREVWVTECYVRVDYDGDGVAELRKVTVAGDRANVVLDNEEIEEIPFADLTPSLVPHRVFGQSIDDLIGDIQTIKTTLLRQGLDNLYLSNNPMMQVDYQNIVDFDALMTPRPGGLIRTKTPTPAVTPIAVPFVAQHAFTSMEYLDQIKEQRAGFNRYAQGSDENALNKTATGIVQLQNAAMERVMLIARLFAETGVTRLFRLVLWLVCKHQQKARIIKLRNQWVPMDPRGWSDQMDFSISVGLGNGNKDQQFAMLNQIALLQEKVVALQGGANGPLVTMQNLYDTAGKIVQAAGMKVVDPFFTDPSRAPQQQPAPPPPDPAVLKAQAQIEADRAKTQSDMELERMKAANQAEIDRGKAQAQVDLERFKAEQKAAIDAWLATQREGRDQDKAQTQQNIKLLQTQVDGLPQLAEQIAKQMMAPLVEQVGNALGGVQGEIAQLAKQFADYVSAPREIVDGPDGRPMGIKIGDNLRTLKRGPNGRARGLN